MIGAFFDMDDTLLHGSSGSMTARYLVETGRIGPRQIFTSLYFYILAKALVLDYDRLVEAGMDFFCGSTETELDAIASGVYEKHISRSFYRLGIESLRRHQDMGHEIVLITASPLQIARIVADNLFIKHICATIPVFHNGRLGSRVAHPVPYGRGKLQLARLLAEELNIDLEQSYFYTDSVTDLPLLEKVGNPRPVNPDPALEITARLRGWKISRFRAFGPLTNKEV